MATENIHTLENPIDVMPLIHKEFRAVSDRTEAMAAEASTFDDVLALNKSLASGLSRFITTPPSKTK